MLIAVLIGLGGLAATAIAYANRNQLDEDHPLLRRAPYFAMAVASVAIAVGTQLVLNHGRTPNPVGFDAGTTPSPP
jgi:hypothetical protein